MSRSHLAPRVYFVANHRLQVRCFAPLLSELSRRGERATLLVIDEHVGRGHIEPELLEDCAAVADVRRLRKRLADRIAGRLGTHRDPTRQAVWGKRIRRVVERRGRRAIVVVPLHPPLLLRWPAGGPRLLGLHHEPFLYRPDARSPAASSVEEFLVWGPWMERTLRGLGVTVPITVTGSPWLTPTPPNQPPGQRLRVLYATQPSPDPRRKIDSPISPAMKRWALEEIRLMLARDCVSRLTIKLHPMDEGAVERDFVATAKDERVRLVAHSEPAADLHRLLQDHDVLLTFFSTVAYEAIVQGRQTVSFDPGGISSAIQDFVTPGVSIGVAGDGALAEEMARLSRPTPEQVQQRAAARARFLADTIRYSGEEARKRAIERILDG